MPPPFDLDVADGRKPAAPRIPLSELLHAIRHELDEQSLETVRRLVTETICRRVAERRRQDADRELALFHDEGRS